MSQSVGPQDTGTVQMSNGGGVSPTSFGYYPPEGSRVISTRYNFGTLLNYFEDLSFSKALGLETAIQSIFIDNSQNSQAVTAQIAGTNQFLVIPANSQGIFPAFFTDNPGVYLSVPAAGGFTRCHFLNVPCGGAAVWPSTNAQISQNGSGVQIPNLVGTQYFRVTAVSAGTTVIIPAVSGKRFFINSILLVGAPNSTITGGGNPILSIEDGSSIIYSSTFSIPATSTDTDSGPLVGLNMNNLAIISTAQNQALNLIYTGSSIVTGGFACTVTGGYTTYTP